MMKVGPGVLVSFLFCLLIAGEDAWAQQTTRVSVGPGGVQSNFESDSLNPAISADGRFVAFSSAARNLEGPEDNNGFVDVFVHDRQTGTTTRVSVRSDGVRAVGGQSDNPAISADGRFVAFDSGATNLVGGGSNGLTAIYVHDRLTGTTTRVSRGGLAGPIQANGLSHLPAISADGRFVAFQSAATNLVPNDTNGVSDIYVHDRRAVITTRVSVRSNGVQSNGNSSRPTISANGRVVAFESVATNLVNGDTNLDRDIFVRDRQTGTTTRVSHAGLGGAAQANGNSSHPAISADGLLVAFDSTATNLVPSDPNGVLSDIFVHDREAFITRRVSVELEAFEPDAVTRRPAISPDGRFVVFLSIGTNRVFLRDRQTGTSTLVSVNSVGVEPTFGTQSRKAGVSANGQLVVFDSDAVNLVPNDTNQSFDVFAHSRMVVEPAHAEFRGRPSSLPGAIAGRILPLRMMR